ncbi:MAG: sulfatase-like hydrolase/transferase [Alphaproteobacteria bacterium]|nr:sulfatase-like hydrolase/transferase [Alphaproteobacteria bacterium]
MAGANVLVIMADELSRSALGCYGNALVHTPHIDSLAARGTRFANAYTPSPICVPARAALATGRYVHQIGHWDSAHPYDGRIQGWAHRLCAAGHQVASIGKLHYRSTADDNGFSQELLPMHVVDGQGWVRGLLRDPLPSYEETALFAAEIGAGSSSYTDYDRTICDRACRWIEEAAAEKQDKPWVLFTSFASPHYPLVVPDEFLARYDPDHVPEPRGRKPDHPVLRELAAFFDYDRHFDDAGRRRAVAAYFGLCSFTDALVGRLLAALQNSGQADRTVVLFTSDHGEMLGAHGFWAKSVMYEDAAAVPLILCGPGVGAGQVCESMASLIDAHPTIMELATGVRPQESKDVLALSLLDLANRERPGRTVLSEYHDGGAPTGIFMVRWDRWKYVHYVGYAPQLFDLVADPDEDRDLAGSPAHADMVAEGERRLREILDPEAVNAAAFAAQAARIAELGGRERILASADFGHTPAPS